MAISPSLWVSPYGTSPITVKLTGFIVSGSASLFLFSDSEQDKKRSIRPIKINGLLKILKCFISL
jgi:hypothetical protein